MPTEPNWVDTGDETDDPRKSATKTGTGPDQLLEARCVRYPDRPDRYTISPPGFNGFAGMETWLTANWSVFVDLADWR